MRELLSRIGLVVPMALATMAGALVPDPQIMTDHPVYRGELACSTLDRNIADAYRIFQERYDHEPKTDADKLVALWAWKSEHYSHASDNIIYVGPDHIEAAKEGPTKGWMDSRDCQLTQFSFSFGLCYSVHAQMCALVGRALGDPKRVRCPLVPGHTSFEAFVDGKWALADFTTGMMVFDDDGKPMEIAQIVPYAVKDDKDWMSDPKRGGFGKFAMTPFGDNWDVYKQVKEHQMLYGYNAMPIVYSLRAGETFTRYLDPGLEDGQTWVFWGRDYYNIMGKPKHGSFRNVTFMDDYPVGDGKRGNGRTYYGNGVFEYAPALADAKYREGIESEKAAAYDDGALRGTAADAFVAFRHASPYVIGARSMQGGDREWKLLEEKCADGAIVSGRAVGKVPVAVSVDRGKTWQKIGTAEGDFKIDFTDVVKGRHTYIIRLGLSPEAGLKALKLRTVTQVGRGVFPRLKDGGTKVTYASSGQSVIHGGPSQYLAENFRREDPEAGEGVRIYQVQAPGPIRFAAGMFRASGPSRGPWTVEFSLDGGKTWTKRFDVTLKEGESGWGGGHHAYAWADMAFPDNKQAKDVLLRFGKGNICHAEVYATYQDKSTSGLEVTYGWSEDGKRKEHTQRIPAGKAKDTWTVPTGKGVQAQWVRFTAK